MIYPGNINFLKDPIVNRNSFDVVDIANQRLTLRFAQR